MTISTWVFPDPLCSHQTAVAVGSHYQEIRSRPAMAGVAYHGRCVGPFHSHVRLPPHGIAVAIVIAVLYPFLVIFPAVIKLHILGKVHMPRIVSYLVAPRHSLHMTPFTGKPVGGTVGMGPVPAT